MTPWTQIDREQVERLEKQRRLDQLYMDIAFRVADESHDYRRRVGAVLVKDGTILSFGWNGTPAGHDNNCVVHTLKHTPQGLRLVDESPRSVMHAEMNLLAKLTRSNLSAEGATVYCTDQCCEHCSPFLVQARIKEFVYSKPYRNTDGIRELHSSGILLRNMDGLTGSSCLDTSYYF